MDLQYFWLNFNLHEFSTYNLNSHNIRMWILKFKNSSQHRNKCRWWWCIHIHPHGIRGTHCILLYYLNKIFNKQKTKHLDNEPNPSKFSMQERFWFSMQKKFIIFSWEIQCIWFILFKYGCIFIVHGKSLFEQNKPKHLTFRKKYKNKNSKLHHTIIWPKCSEFRTKKQLLILIFLVEDLVGTCSYVQNLECLVCSIQLWMCCLYELLKTISWDRSFGNSPHPKQFSILENLA